MCPEDEKLTGADAIFILELLPHGGEEKCRRWCMHAGKPKPEQNSGQIIGKATSEERQPQYLPNLLKNN